MQARTLKALHGVCVVLLLALPTPATPPKEERVMVAAGYAAFHSPDGKWLAFKSGGLKLGLMSTAPKAKPFPEADMSHATFTADSKFLIGVDFNKQVQFISLATGKPAKAIPIPFKNESSIANSVAVSHDGKKLAVTVSGGGMVFDAVAKGGKSVELEKCISHGLVFSKDDATVIGHDGDGKIITWDAATGKQTNSWAVGARDIVRCAFTADRKLAAAAEADTGVIHLWNVAEGKEVGTLQSLKFVNSLSLTPDGKKLAVACGENMKRQIQIWDVDEQKELEGIPELPTRSLSVSFSPDGKLLTVSTERSFDGKVPPATRLYSLK